MIVVNLLLFWIELLFLVGVLIVLVFFSFGGDVKFFDVGCCEFMEYYCSVLNCSIVFVKEF